MRPLKKNVTSSPTLTARGGGGGGGPRKSKSKGVVVDKTPKVRTESATNVSVVSATLNMTVDFNDYNTVQVQFKYKASGDIDWNGTDWVSLTGSGSQCYTETIDNLSANTTYYFFALLQYDDTKLNGTEVNFTTSRESILLAPTPALTLTPTLTPTSAPTLMPTPTLMLTPTLTPTSAPTPTPTPGSRPTIKPKPRPTIKPKPRPTIKP